MSQRFRCTLRNASPRVPPPPFERQAPARARLLAAFFRGGVYTNRKRPTTALPCQIARRPDAVAAAANPGIRFSGTGGCWRVECAWIRHRAQVLELADKLDLGSSALRGVRVRISPWAPRRICPGGETGRHKGLKIPRPQGHAGSSPAPGTRLKMEAEVGIEPAYTELQSAAWPLCHSALRVRIRGARPGCGWRGGAFYRHSARNRRAWAHCRHRGERCCRSPVSVCVAGRVAASARRR